MVSFLGMGLLGSNFTKALLQKGQQVNVWNRTYEKAKALETFGAKAFDNAADAVKGAERIHLTLSDDAVVDEVLEKAKPALKPGCIIIDHSTTSTRGAAKRSDYWKQQGFFYLHAPVFMGPPNALDGTGYMLVSGNQELIKQVEPILAGMTGKLLNFGPEPERAAGIKLMGNSFLLFLTVGISDTLALGKSMNVPASDLVSLFDSWNPGSMAPARLKRMLKGGVENPSWELKMARKDARLMMEEAQADHKHLAALPAIAAEMDKWIDKGYGNNDWTILAKENV